MIKKIDAKEDIEKELYEQVNNSANFVVERYAGENIVVRKLGNLVQKVYSKVEGEMDDLIINWSEGIGSKDYFLRRITSSLKYYPLLNNMNFSQKINVLQSNKIIKKNKDKIKTQLRWLNDLRNEFAHYNSHHTKLENEYGNKNNRIKTLKKLNGVLHNVHVLKKIVELAVDKSS